MQKTALYLSFILLGSTPMIAVTQQLYDVVHLKNGIIIKGIIIEQIPGKSIKIKSDERLLIEILYTDIEKLTKESITAVPEKIDKSFYPINTGTLKNYFFKLHGGFFSGDAIGYSFGAEAGIRIGKHFSLSLQYHQFGPESRLTEGASQEKYKRFKLSNYGVRGYYNLSTHKPVNTYFALGNGYSSSPFTGSAGIGYYASYYLNPGIGIDVPIGKNIFLFSELTYNLHFWKDIYNPGTIDEVKKTAQAISWTLGVKF